LPPATDPELGANRELDPAGAPEAFEAGCGVLAVNLVASDTLLGAGFIAIGVFCGANGKSARIGV
jgi:hypothetical protein